MPDEKDAAERKRVEALEAELSRVKAQFEASQKEQARLLEERNQLMDAALFAARHGDSFVAHYYDSIRLACEETDIDAESLILKLPPLTLDFLTPDGIGRYLKKLRETLTDEEFHVCGHANEIALESLWDEMRKRSSQA